MEWSAMIFFCDLLSFTKCYLVLGWGLVGLV